MRTKKLLTICLLLALASVLIARHMADIAL